MHLRKRKRNSGKMLNRIGSMAMIGSLLLLVSCTTPKLPTAQTASQQFAALGRNREKGIAKNFYSLDQGDAAKRWHWDTIEAPAHRPAAREAQAHPDPIPQH